MHTNSPYGAVVTHLTCNEKILSSTLSAGFTFGSCRHFCQTRKVVSSFRIVLGVSPEQCLARHSQSWYRRLYS